VVAGRLKAMPAEMLVLLFEIIVGFMCVLKAGLYTCIRVLSLDGA
jgi:hypothetical protein